MDNIKKFCAEFIGTFVLVLFACGTATVVGCNGAEPNGAYILTALAFGLVIVAMAYSIGNVSGCHINPAVSLAMLLRKKMEVNDFIGYVVAQVIGAIAGAGLLYAIVGPATFAAGGGGCNGFNELSAAQLTGGQAFLAEVVLTFCFLMAIIGVTSKPEYDSVAGLVIGLTLTLVHIFGIPLTGTSVNPARSIGPAIFGSIASGGKSLLHMFIFIIGPMCGAFVAAFIYSFLIKDKDQ